MKFVMFTKQKYVTNLKEHLPVSTFSNQPLPESQLESMWVLL